MPSRPTILSALKTPRRAALTGVVLAMACAAAALPGMLEEYHEPLTHILKQVVREETLFLGTRDYSRTEVSYKKLKEEKLWQPYMHRLRKADPTKLKVASRDDQKAFWINAYNVLVLDTAISNYPLRGGIQSVRDVWNKPNPVGRYSLSLKQIEEKLRALQDPRVFFALCQAARSSPRLSARAYLPTSLEEQLENAVNNFCTDPRNYRLDRAKNQLHLSQLFERHAADLEAALPRVPAELKSFPSRERAVLAFLFARIPGEDKRHILAKRPKIVFEPFDWSLNQAR